MSTSPGGEPYGAADERIESYLDELMLAMRGRPRDTRRLLREAEDHLRQLVQAGLAAGLDKDSATEQALARFGPPAAVARGLPKRAAYQTMTGQLAETVLLVMSLLLLAAGAAAVPAAIVALAGNAGLITGDPPGQAVPAAWCQQLLQMTAGHGCAQALAVHHVAEVIRNHLLGGCLGIVTLAIWWAWHVHRKTRPVVLPSGFSLTVCATLLSVTGVFLLAAGIRDAVLGITAIGGLIGSADLAGTGATVTATALLCWLLLARQATRARISPGLVPGGYRS
jgi:hypothetical protein